ncbi:hypothetical protein IDJ75_20190 [Mucilaginibacter rigui]|uniref:Anti-sigma factor n=1 Tax=Mucilaginibacter rigui TaxID=534635 RepID=A0ABR7XAR4_9SPHI|nr:hypothetical protein [Mucilaginibacter rigui]MBD1387616.1 hypothetical protein [Mucilaginibacter rigui]
MEQDKIVLLLEKYWKAETTLEEEKIIKKYLATNQDKNLEENYNWFKVIEKAQSIAPKPIEHSGKSNGAFKLTLTKIAASVIVITAGFLWGLNYYNRVQAEKDIVLSKQVEADLIYVAEALDQGYDNLNESKDILLDIKPLK